MQGKMMRIMKILLFMGVAMAAGLSANTPKYALTLDGLYIRPLASDGYSLRTTSGEEGKLGLEWRMSSWAALGLETHYIQMDTFDSKTELGGGGLTLRWIPVSEESFETYLLLGAGMDAYSKADLKAQARDSGFVGQAGAGEAIPVTRAWALQFGGEYEARPEGKLLNLFGARAGLQYRFDNFFGAKTKATVAEPKLRELRTTVRLNGQDMDLASQSHLADTDIKSWKVEVRTKDGVLLRTFEGQGPLPATIDMGDLKDRKDLSFTLSLKGATGMAESRQGILASKAGSGPSVAKVKNVMTAKDDTLWGISGREEVYGDPLLYYLIFDANSKTLSDPDFVPAGVKLEIPRQVSKKQKHDALMRAWQRSEKKVDDEAEAQSADKP
jgi:hypothetical protein